MSNLKRTALHDLHRELGAKMVGFAAYEMPLHYPSGIIAEHRHTRERAGLFDVSHMGQVRLSGPDAAADLELLVPADIVGLAFNRQRYTFFTNDRGGILDDLMVGNTGDHLLLVVNAARTELDVKHLRTQLGAASRIEPMTDQALLALQGPEAGAVLHELMTESADLKFMHARRGLIAGADCWVARSGYTGEDGFEISVPAEHAERVARALLQHAAVEPVGLGARDTLRLEAGLCLYGQDIDTSTTPVEADLAWAIPPVRRVGGGRAGGFPGAQVVFEQLATGPRRRRVGIRPVGKAPVRAGAELLAIADRPVGSVTSGSYGPSIGGPVAMGYVEAAWSESGTPLRAMVRGKAQPVNVADLPFVVPRYHRR